MAAVWAVCFNILLFVVVCSSESTICTNRTCLGVCCGANATCLDDCLGVKCFKQNECGEQCCIDNQCSFCATTHDSQPTGLSSTVTTAILIVVPMFLVLTFALATLLCYCYSRHQTVLTQRCELDPRLADSQTHVELLDNPKLDCTEKNPRSCQSNRGADDV